MFRSCKVGSYNVYKIYKRKKYIFCFPANGWPNSNVNVQGPFNMILWLRKILFITRNIWGNKCMTYFKGPCTKFEVELMSFFIHFGCICTWNSNHGKIFDKQWWSKFYPENIETTVTLAAGPPQIFYVKGLASDPVSNVFSMARNWTQQARGLQFWY